MRFFTILLLLLPLLPGNAQEPSYSIPSWTYANEAPVEVRSLPGRALGRTVRYTVLQTGPDAEHLIYLTDGQKLVENGFWAQIEELTRRKIVPPARYVLVSSIDATGTDHRNDDFFCNAEFLRFFVEELLPTVEGDRPVERSRRSLVGVSFGGLNAAWFAAMDAPFGNYGLLSPITYPRREELSRRIVFGPQSGQRFFVSTGRYDAEKYVDQLLALYAGMEVETTVLRTEGGHDFTNWSAQLPDLLNFLQQ